MESYIGQGNKNINKCQLQLNLKRNAEITGMLKFKRSVSGI